MGWGGLKKNPKPDFANALLCFKSEIFSPKFRPPPTHTHTAPSLPALPVALPYFSPKRRTALLRETRLIAIPKVMGHKGRDGAPGRAGGGGGAPLLALSVRRERLQQLHGHK